MGSIVDPSGDPPTARRIVDGSAGTSGDTGSEPARESSPCLRIRVRTR